MSYNSASFVFTPSCVIVRIFRRGPYVFSTSTCTNGPISCKPGICCSSPHFAQDEIDLLRATAQADDQLQSHAFGKLDGNGNPVRLSVWNHPGDTIYGMFARCERIVDVAEQILEEEPYHYHSKMIMKDAGTGAAWEWHQDYGYWYDNGLLQPLLTSCFIAIDAATEENGCLQVVPQSQKLGRIDHQRTGQQAVVEARAYASNSKNLPCKTNTDASWRCVFLPR